MADPPATPSRFDAAHEVEEYVRMKADEVHDPCSMAIGLNVGLTEMGLIRHVVVSPAGPDWSVQVNVRLTSPGCQYFFYFQEQLQARLLSHPQIVQVDVTWDHQLDWTPEDMAESARQRFAQRMSRLPPPTGSTRAVDKATV
jgi:metal-sulfur cluster biosynthetic enzyme